MGKVQNPSTSVCYTPSSEPFRIDKSVVYNCCWASPAQLNPAGLKTVFYCLKSETPPLWRARSPYLYSLETGWPSYNPKSCVPFSSPPTTRRATVEVFEPASTERIAQETPLPVVLLLLGDVAICKDRTENNVHLFPMQSFLRSWIIYCAVT
jgi:hypothetical protein